MKMITTPENMLFRLTNSLLLRLGAFFIIVAIFVLYVRAEEQADHANELRQQSFVLADELRQSSDDLTRMARSYVLTGETIYKRHYQEILDIRNGIKPRPVEYHDIYWDMVLPDDIRPRPMGPALSMREMLVRAGFTKQEFDKLDETLSNSNMLANTELAAMQLSESAKSPSSRDKAISMMHDAAYHQAKANIMRPISQFSEMAENRTLGTVHLAEDYASMMRHVFMLFAAVLFLLLLNMHFQLQKLLGCKLNELYTHIASLGNGEFKLAIPVTHGKVNSILGWLSETQFNLGKIDKQRKFAEEKLADLEEQSRLILSSVEVGIVGLDTDGIITFSNPSVGKLLGYTSEEIIGKQLHALVHYAYPDGSNFPIEECSSYLTAQDGKPRTLNNELLWCKNGTALHVEYATTPIYKDSKLIGTVVVFRDISGRKEAERSLRESIDLLGSVVEHIPAKIFWKDLDSRFLGCNKKFSTNAGCSSPDELSGKTDFDMVWKDQAEMYRADDKAVMESGLPKLNYEEVQSTPEGGMIWVSTSKIPLCDENNQVIGLLGILYDITEKKWAEETLLKASALQSAIFNSANFSCIATDAKGVIQIFNVGAEHMLGYKSADVVNKITPADISDSQELIARAEALSTELDTLITPGFEALVFKATRGIEDIYELTYMRKDCSSFPANVSVTALRDSHNVIIGYLLIGTDNTARKQIEADKEQLSQRLRDNQFYTRSLFESNIDALMTSDAEGIITDINKQMETLTGCTRDELIGSPFKSYFTDPKKAQAGINQVLSERKITNYELIVKARNGKETPVSYNAVTLYDRNRMITGVFAAARDITEHKRQEYELNEAKENAEEASRIKSEFLVNRKQDADNLREMTDRFSLAARAGGVGIWDYDPVNNILVWDDQMYRLYGITVDQFSGAYEAWEAGLHPEDRARGDAEIQMALSGEKAFDTEFRVVWPDGDIRSICAIAKVQRDVSGQAIRMIGTNWDITAQTQTEIALIKAKQLAVSANIAKSEFLSNMSHELRTPLNAIIGFSEALKDGLMGDVAENQREYINDIFTSGEHLLSLINDILDLAKVEAGKMELELEQFSLGAVLQNSLSMVKEKAMAHRLSVTLETDAGMPEIVADMRKLKQIIYNLLSNAVKFTPDGGTVTLGAHRVDNMLEISVRDAGIGISAENLAKLFQPFTQIDGALARKYQGTGLGLVMIKHLAELHGGSVSVESEVDKGSLFLVWIPWRLTVDEIVQPFVPKKPTSQNMPNTVVSKKSSDALNALIIEDDPSAAMLIRLHLETEGLRVSSVNSGEQALEWLANNHPDLITIDLLLPGMDGLEVMQRIKQMPIHSAVPFVIISIVADENRGLVLGASQILQKPFSQAELHDALKTIGISPASRQRSTDLRHSLLVVDDDPQAVERMSSQLKHSYRVSVAHSGAEGIALARSEHFDAILIDLLVPEISFIEVVVTLKKDPATAPIPVIILSSKALTEEDRHRLNSDIERILEKSEFRPEALINEVRRIIERK